MLRPLGKLIVYAGICLFGSLLSADEPVIEFIPLQHRPANELQPLLAPLLEKSDQVFSNGNGLIVKCSSGRLASIKKLVEKLDTALPNLVITVIRSSHRSADELNASATVNATVPLRNPGASNSSTSGFQASTDRIKEEESKQVIRTLPDQPAYIKTGRLHPFNNFSAYNFGTGYATVTTNTRLVEATSGFMVVPRLSGQQVILEISPWSDNINRRGGIETQSARTTIRTTFGSWVEIASAGQDEQSQQTGYLRHSWNTRRQTMHILLKVDRID